VAKLIVWAEDRPTAIRKMAAALRDTVLLGVTNNGQFLQDVLVDGDFRTGQVYTTWVEDRFHEWQPPNCALPPEVLIAAALTQFQAAAADESGGGEKKEVRKDPFTPWGTGSGFRVANQG
jgi:acetyl/propionyl-CoA carboxylase alpha subunit